MPASSARSRHVNTAFRSLTPSTQAYVVASVVVLVLAALFARQGRLEVTASLIAIFAGAALVQPIPKTVGGLLVPNLALVLIATLLWQPQEVLLGVGLGSFVGLLVFRKTEVWRAALNGAMSALPAAAATEAARRVAASGPGTWVVVTLIAAAILAMIVYGVFHTVFFVLYRRLQFHRSVVSDWLDYVVQNPGNQLIATPVAVVLAEVSRQLSGVSGDAVGLVLTAACALALPLARQELAYYHQSQQMLEEIAEALIRVLDRVMPGAREHSERVGRIAVETGRRLGLSERALMTLGLAARLHDVGLLTKADGSAGKDADGSAGNTVLDHVSNRLLAAIIQAHHERWVDREGYRPHRRTLVSSAASILAAAELYDSARTGMRPFNRPISREAVERELTRLAGSTLDPDIVPVVLRVGQEIGSELVGAPY